MLSVSQKQTRGSLAALAIVLGLTQHTAADLLELVEWGGITGVASRDGQTVDPQSLSMEGGANLNIEGRMMLRDPSSNTVFFGTDGDLTSAIAADYDLVRDVLSEDDQFKSNPRMGFLSYTSEPIYDILGGTYDDFNGEALPDCQDENCKLITKVASSTWYQNECTEDTTDGCTIRYRRNYTPLLLDVTPANVYAGQRVQFHTYLKNTNDNVAEDAMPIQDFKIGANNMNYEYDDDSTLYNQIDEDYKPGGWSSSYFQGTIEEIYASSSEEPIIRFEPGYPHHSTKVTHSNFAGDDTWKIRVHPRIDSLDYSEGWVSGGQDLTITGYSLGSDANDITVTIDGVACEVDFESSTWESLKCSTGSADAASNTDTQPGVYGITVNQVDPEDTEQTDGEESEGVCPSFDDMRNGVYDGDETNTVLYTSWEEERNRKEDHGVWFQGYFKAMATANHRFYTSGRHWNEVNMDFTTPYDATTPVTHSLENICYTHNIDWRHWHNIRSDSSPISDWIPLEEGKYYAMETLMRTWGGDSHYTLSVEIETADSTGHPNARRAQQYLEITNDDVPEIWTLTVEGIDDGMYKLNFLHPTTSETWQSDELYANMSANDFKWVIDEYFWQDPWWTGIDVTVEYYDDTDTLLDSADGTEVKSIYTVQALRRFESYTFSSVTVLIDSTAATVTVQKPEEVQLSGAPLDGYYSITCTDANDIPWTTADIWFSWGESTVQEYINKGIPFLADKVEVVRDNKYDYVQNGLQYVLNFRDYEADPAQCTIQDAGNVDYPLTGENPTFVQSTSHNYGTNLMFEPVPLEMMRTYAEAPQIEVLVDGIVALCPNFNCDFAYVDAVGEIDGMTISGTSVSITGTDLPTSDFTVTVADQECNSGTHNALDNEITCSLDEVPVAGNVYAIVKTPTGVVSIADGTAELEVDLTITSASTSQDLNRFGGSTIEIVGTNFGYVASDVSVVLTDDGTVCDVQYAVGTSITCVTTEVVQVDDCLGAAPTVTVTINSKTATSTDTLSCESNVYAVASISPATVSPVLYTTVTLTIEDSYSGTFTEEDTTITLVSLDGEMGNETTDVVREMYITAIDNDSVPKTINISFPGSPSGYYVLKMETVNEGRWDYTNSYIQTIGEITGISPLQGSATGGTLITITGRHFADSVTEGSGQYITDNNVTIGYNGPDCLLEYTTETEIVCRIEETDMTVDDEAQIFVFLKLSEEAVCNNGGDGCYFTWLTAKHEVTGAIASVDDDGNQIITITSDGSSLFSEDNESGVELWLDGYAQQTNSVSVGEAVFQITNIDGTSTDVVKLLSAEGYSNTSSEETIGTVSLTPTLISISPEVGSIGGSVITVTGSGFGTSVDGIGLYDGTQEICTSTEIVSYGVFTCTTDAVEIDNVNMQLSISGSYYDCAVNSSCVFSQLTASSPALSDVTLAGSSMTFTGSNFPTSDYDVVCIYQGVEQAGTISSDTEIVCDWTTLGVPLSETDASPSVVFRSTANPDTDQLTAVNDSVVLSNPPASAPTSTATTCSFAGGCSYTISGDGFYASMQNSDNSISVCAVACEIDDDASSASEIVCTLPDLATTFSITDYQIDQSEIMSLTWTSSSGDATEEAKLNDGEDDQDYTDASSECYFATTFDTNYVAVLEEVSVFLNDLDTNEDRALIADLLVFQGSDDDFSTTTDLWTVSTDLHNGWNTIIWDLDDGDTLPAYNSYRFIGSGEGACRVSEVKIYGVEAIANEDSSYACTPVMTVDSVEYTLEDVTYDSTVTPSLSAISPRFGTVYGDTTVTLTGTGFGDGDSAQVWFDDRVCTVQSMSDTEIVCVTEDKPYVADEPRVRISIPDKGDVATQGLLFRYVYYYSDPRTWNDNIPVEGESIEIPVGQHLLVDVDATEHLNHITVQGSLIFAPDEDDDQHQRSLDANIIIVYGGYFEAGTEDFPYTSKLTITMHGAKGDPTLPIYGQKVIGVRYGHLEMHGPVRTPTWTQMSASSAVGATSIQLKEEVDWQVGEYIVIASSDFEGRNAEKRQITAVSNSGDTTTVEFETGLEFGHFGLIETYGGVDVDMRCEVGLLSRNVVYRGDPETSNDNQFGAHIMLHSPGNESLIGKIAYTEFTDVGQAFQLGRYPIHFHMIGTIHNSYAKGNAIHQTYNRAITLHGIHYFTIQDNVAYDTMGHTIFVEDAAETHNLIERNLIVQTKRSWSLLNTDQTPSCFWITHPNNIFRDNHAAGSDRYGFWYDTQETAMGPSYDPNICPQYEKVGEFTGNVAHSMGRYGLRLFHIVKPREKPCESLSETNAAIAGQFSDFTAYKCQRNGAIALDVGNIQFTDFKIADSILAGIEFEMTWDAEQGECYVDGATVVGRTPNTEHDLDIASPHGIITARSENFQFHNVNFYNYNWNNAAAIGTCSHCFHDAATDSGARTIRTSGLTFTDVDYKINYQIPWRAIIQDEDGSLTGMGANSWATPYWKHNHWDGVCEIDTTMIQIGNTFSEEMQGLVCPPEVQVRRIAFSLGSPWELFMQGIRIMQWNDDQVAALEADESYVKTDYVFDASNGSLIPFKDKQNPTSGWAVPFVTGNTYRVYMGAQALDFDTLNMDLSDQWETDDDSIELVMPYTEGEREEFYISSGGERITDQNMASDAEGDWVAGHNMYSDPTDEENYVAEDDDFELRVIANAKDADKMSIDLEGWQCAANECPDQWGFKSCDTDTPLYWSDASNWPDGVLPVEGDSVEITTGWFMYYDLEGDSPLFDMVLLQGCLTFQQPAEGETVDRNLRTQHMFVANGELYIGSEDDPFRGNAQITLTGHYDSAAVVFDQAIEAGNKVVSVVGKAHLYGQGPAVGMTRLNSEVQIGDSSITVTAADVADWNVGDRIFIGPTSWDWQSGEHAEISAIDTSTGVITLTDTVSFYHYGTAESTAPLYNDVTDIRGEVVNESRNVRIVGDTEIYDDTALNADDWGGQIVCADHIDINGKTYSCNLIFDNVELAQMSQENTDKAALRFEGAITNNHSVTNCVFHEGLGWGMNIKNAANVSVSNTQMLDFRTFGVNIIASQSVALDEVFVSTINMREVDAIGMIADKQSCYAVCSYNDPDTTCTEISIQNSIASGCYHGGFVTPGYTCGEAETQTSFKNNVGHSIDGFGARFFPSAALEDSTTCFEGGSFSAYHNHENGVIVHHAATLMIMRDMQIIDNAWGIGLINSGTEEGREVQIYDVHLYGETEGTDDFCSDRFGIEIEQHGEGERALHPTSSSALPIHKLKSYSTWWVKVNYSDMTFNDYTSQTTSCGAKQTVFGLNSSAPDYADLVNMINTTINNVAMEALAYIYDPKEDWANVTDCGEWPCTGPENVVIKFTGTTYGDSDLQPFDYEDFQIVGDISASTINYDDCSKVDEWNAWVCQNPLINILLFESLDADTEDRSVQPVTISNFNGEYVNIVNSFMDHCWDGFYSCQLRLSRFPVQLALETDYQIDFAGTPPGSMRFKFDEATMGQTPYADQGAGSLIRVNFPESAAYKVYDSAGVELTQNEWDEDLGAPGYLTKNAGIMSDALTDYPNCGEWRYKGLDNYIDMYMTPGCNLEIRKRDAILSSVRMEWTLAEFYEDGGTTAFADRVSAALGVHASQVKVVAVYYGSVNVEYIIDTLPEPEFYEEAELTAGLTEEEIAEIDLSELIATLEITLTESITSNVIDFGATVLEASVAGGNELVATDLTTAGFGASASNAESPGFSATDALGSFALMMVPTVMVLSREPELMDLLGDLYNSMTDPEEQEEVEQAEEIILDETHGDSSIFRRDFGLNFLRK